MQDDKTVFMELDLIKKELYSDSTRLMTGLRVSVMDASGKTTDEFFFKHGFTAGRSQDNDIVIQNNEVSRHHLEVKWEHEYWWIYDLNSANGIYIHNSRLEHKSKLDFPVLVSMGDSGISLKIQPTEQCTETGKLTKDVIELLPAKGVFNVNVRKDISREAIIARFLTKEEAEDAGDYTRMVRALIHEDRSSRGKRFKKAIWGLGILFLLAVGSVAYQQVALSNARTLAIDMFYDIKMLEVSLSQADIRLEESADLLEQTIKAAANEKLKIKQEEIKVEQEKILAERKRMRQERKKLKRMKAKYQQYVKEATSFRLRFPTDASYEEELITKVAREFNESELELPDGFVEKVKQYIRYWQHSPRLEEAIARLEKNNYASAIISALEKEGLPLYFLYLPLQESNYDTQAIGPVTPHGVAKGAWQLLATTGQEYGLLSGPLAAVREYDELDARFDFNKATRAGTKYLKHIYSTEAQVSGLLVMASYNYGHNRVRDMIEKMPDNPRDRNFWKFIKQYQIPKETYDYVFYIFSAAVIGEDPKHFGFKFNPPLSMFSMKESKSE
ncbi:FHA domain-containing protein [Candidatus Methylobacter favarea]|uniref:FHA domain-containing protein n=1 Tax=Candidatus Methylobacter favarea TaxID=2707345 RepID=A0A8S0WMD0_9GAMM|nr:FHA domain-containing protein [Candidatus Methylobacter favarea]CAA9889660.1 FHA domain-containing protein [Candidatus Methylobacter favarea]